MAGANERAGFIDTPDINAKKNMSKPTIPPIAIYFVEFSIRSSNNNALS